MITAVNPATEQAIQSYSKLNNQQVVGKIAHANANFLAWRKTRFEHRADLLRQVAEILRKQTDKFAHLITAEMGKPIAEARSEVEKCAWVCDYYADHAATFLQKEIIETDASKSYVSFPPLGVVLAIMPWNFPLWQVFRFAAPALMAGNAALLKHAPNVPGCGEAIQDIFEEAGFPNGLFANLLIDVEQVPPILEHPLVRAATLTGSGRAGSAVATTAGKNIKKTVLELGGSDAYLILHDADVEQTAEVCTKSRLLNTGQSCIGAKRFITVPEVHEAFVKQFKAKMQAAKMGDPMNEEHTIGSLARPDLRDNLHRQVTESVERGAKVILGGQIPDGKGAFYPPTILTEVGPGMPAFDEELFGPVAAIIAAKDEEEAIQLANASDYGLGAAVFTTNVERGEQIALERLEAGSCFVNGLVKSDPRLPFGGIKVSGYGRELSHYGIKEFVNIKTVWVK